MKHVWLLSLVLGLTVRLLPAQEVLRGHLFFESGAYELTDQHGTLLGTWLDSLAQLNWQDLTIEAHTDTVGSDEFNRKLSERRAASVRAFLLGRAIDSSRVMVEYYGEAEADSTAMVIDNDALKRFSRRVDLVATLPSRPEEAVDLAALYKQLKGGYTYLHASMRTDTTLHTEGGVILCLRRESFLTPTGQVYRGPIELRIQEATALGARLRHNLNQSVDQLQETAGMLEIRAKGNSGSLMMNPNVPITILLPSRSARDSFQVSVAREQPGRPLTWSEIQTSHLHSDAFIPQAYAGADFQQQWNPNRHREAIDYRWGERSKLRMRKLFTGRVYPTSHWVVDTPSAFHQHFQQEYGSFSCPTLGKTPSAALHYYTFNLPSLGWIGCARPIQAASERIDFAVMLPQEASQTDIKLILKGSQSILSGTRRGGQVVFANVPLGQPAQVVALRINGQDSGLAIQETIISPSIQPAPQFETMPLASLKHRLTNL
jgi:hypothetical protein